MEVVVVVGGVVTVAGTGNAGGQPLPSPMSGINGAAVTAREGHERVVLGGLRDRVDLGVARPGGQERGRLVGLEGHARGRLVGLARTHRVHPVVGGRVVRVGLVLTVDGGGEGGGGGDEGGGGGSIGTHLASRHDFTCHTLL